MSSLTDTTTEDIVLPTGEQVYDNIMKQIEPELVLANLQSLDEPYANETDTEHAARYERYGKAFAVYEERYNAWVSDLSSAVSAYKRAIGRATEKVARTREDSELESLASLMLSA